ncbi:MAG TPA: TetR/AcrR family transcriptional regulator [Caulobacteraceae bacterium]|nr:TetR/AcrR family transcriptional regulator [Caulobacteraceae bacterium]
MAIKPGSLGRPSGPTNRTQEERSAATRQKLIDAAIHCLRTYGYAATSTTLVVEMAQLSRGAMLHQFGTKVDLMLAVAEYVVEEQNRFMAEALEAYPVGRERFIALTEVTWQALTQPGAIALLEIMMASRSDADLADRFPAVAERLAQSQRKGAWFLAKQAGITDRETVDAMCQLHRAAMQGLSIMMVFSKDADSLTPMLNQLKRYKDEMVDKLIATSGEPNPRLVKTRIDVKPPT